MKLHILSDLHTELSQYQAHKVDADLVVLAGDIGKGAQGLIWARETWKDMPILFVPGNHEYYRAEIGQTQEEMRKVAEQLDIFYLDNNTIHIDGVRFIGSTLWTDFLLFGEDKKQLAISAGAWSLNDFRVIRNGADTFTPQASIELFEKSRAFLASQLAEPYSGKTVVVTHHLPSMESVSDRWRNDYLSACFSSHVDDLVCKADLWIHGHTHDNFDYRIGKARVVCNPKGYERYSGSENPSFDPRLVIEI